MKLSSIVSKTLSNKWVLNIVAFLALMNVIGYMVMGNLNNMFFFIILAALVRYFSKNMIIILGVPLILVNLLSLKNGSIRFEGMENKDSETIKKINDEKSKKETVILPGTDDTETNVSASNVKTDEHFEVGRPKNGSSKIDYASTIEGAYDELNKILGSEGMKSLTDDTQRLMQQQMELAKSMEAMSPIVEKMLPMADKAQKMMESMETGGNGMSSLLDMAKKMSGGLNKTM
jgi:hypothetical protein